MRHRDDRPRDRHVFCRSGDVRHQRAVDLDDVHRQPSQVAQARVAGAEVVERDLDAERPQRSQVLNRLVEVADQHALGDLDTEQPRIEPARGEQAFDAPRQVRLHQLARRQVHGHAHRRQPGALPGRRLFDGTAQHPVADGDDQAGLFGDRDEAIRRDAAQRGVLPAQQGLDADDVAMLQVHLRLVVQLELLVAQRMAQRRLQHQSFGVIVVARAGIDVDLVATQQLGLVQRGVGAAQQRGGAIAVRRARTRCRCCRSGRSRALRSSSGGRWCRAAPAPFAAPTAEAAGITITNSSPSRRATRSTLRTVATMRCAASRNTASPTCRPKPSLMRLKRSSSRSSTAVWSLVCNVAPRLSKSHWRFGNPSGRRNAAVAGCGVRRRAAHAGRRRKHGRRSRRHWSPG